jgi:hypothetical protein
MMSLLRSGRVAGLFMPLAFAAAIIFCLVRVGQTATDEYFAKKPFFEWMRQRPEAGRYGAIIWHTADLDAEWKVVYHPNNDSRWRTAAAKVTSLIHSDFLTRHRVYNAELSGLATGRPIEFSVFRNKVRVYSGQISDVQTR